MPAVTWSAFEWMCLRIGGNKKNRRRGRFFYDQGGMAAAMIISCQLAWLQVPLWQQVQEQLPLQQQ